MPFLNGSQLAKEIKSVAPNVPIVLISGYSALAASELLFVDAHFGRDTVLDDLLETMRSLVRSNRMSARDRQRRDSGRIQRKYGAVCFLVTDDTAVELNFSARIRRPCSNAKSHLQT
jgi:hypothetical protein